MRLSCTFIRDSELNVAVLVWLGQIVVFERGYVGHFERKFQGKGSPTNDCWRQKTTVPELSRGVVCVIICLAVLLQYRRVTDRHTIDG